MNNEPVAWISVLGIDHIGQKFTDVRVSLTKTDVADIPLYTHPAKYCPLENNAAYEKGVIDGMSRMTESAVHQAVQGLVTDDVKRYQWLRNEYAHGRETYLAEGIPSGEMLDEYIDEQLRKAQEK
jgi:hypothetical protein